MNHRALQRGEDGQALVLVIGALTAILAMVALIVDGGNAYVNQRSAQNTSDSAADAGATILSVNINANTKTDTDVATAVTAAATSNGTSSVIAYYTDIEGTMLEPAVQVGSSAGNLIPPCNVPAKCVGGLASGVRAIATKPFNTFFAGVVGISTLTASAEATAVAGYLPNRCDSDEGCVLLPVTFALTANTCDNSGDTVPGPPWVIPTTKNSTGDEYDERNEVILSLCKQSPGAVGWLDYGVTGCNLSCMITDPQQGSVVLPTWFQTQPGNPNNLDGELSEYWGDVLGKVDAGDVVVLIPMFDETCWSPADGTNFEYPTPQVCSKPPKGNNTHFRIPFFVGFLLDRTYTSGSNTNECNALPGAPFVGGNGASGCFKGWFTKIVGPGEVVVGPGPGGPATPTGVQLIK